MFGKLEDIINVSQSIFFCFFPAIPLPPESINLTNCSQNSLQFSWTPPPGWSEKESKDSIKYEVEYRENTSTHWINGVRCGMIKHKFHLCSS